MTTLEEGLKSYLSTYTGLNSLISGRVYHMSIPENATLPCLTYQRIDTPRTTTMDSSGATGDLTSPRFQFDAWAATFSSAKAITDQVRAALNGKTGSVGGVTIRASLASDERSSQDNDLSIYRSQSDYIIWQEE